MAADGMAAAALDRSRDHAKPPPMADSQRSFSASALDKLGKRLAHVSPAPADVEMLLSAQREWQGALKASLDAVSEVARAIPRDERDAPLHVTNREKTVATLVDKLRRGTPLSRMQDVVGVRIVDPSGGLREQDEIVARLKERLGDVRIVDRRSTPSYGYRAVHVIPKIDRRTVEIQIRTGWQHAWANTMEECGDRWGRGIRYGEPSTGASPEEIADRSKQLSDLLRVGEAIARWETTERECVDHARALPRIEPRPDERDRLLTEHRSMDARMKRAFDELAAIAMTDGPLMADFRVQLDRWPLRKNWR